MHRNATRVVNAEWVKSQNRNMQESIRDRNKCIIFKPVKLVHLRRKKKTYNDRKRTLKKRAFSFSRYQKSLQNFLCGPSQYIQDHEFNK